MIHRRGHITAVSGKTAATGKIAVMMVVLLSVCSCFTFDVDRLTRSAPAGFSKEIDDPTSRGALTRISPEHMDVQGKYCVSPDGYYIVFSGVSGTYTADRVLDLWKIPVDGGAPTKLTTGTTQDNNSPSFTSNGTHIVFENGGKIWKIRGDGAGGEAENPRKRHRAGQHT